MNKMIGTRSKRFHCAMMNEGGLHFGGSSTSFLLSRALPSNHYDVLLIDTIPNDGAATRWKAATDSTAGPCLPSL